MMLFTFATPTLLMNSLMAAGGYPLRLIPLMVGIRGSFHPVTCPFSTSSRSFLLLRTVYVMLSRANSVCRGWWIDGAFFRFLASLMASMNQSYRGRWFSNSRVQSEWVIPSMESSSPWAQSYMG